jgi:hypothetical protein
VARTVHPRRQVRLPLDITRDLNVGNPGSESKDAIANKARSPSNNSAFKTFVSAEAARVYRRGADCHPLKKVASVVDVNIFLSCTPLALQASDLVPGSLSEMATFRPRSSQRRQHAELRSFWTSAHEIRYTNEVGSFVQIADSFVIRHG